MVGLLSRSLMFRTVASISALLSLTIVLSVLAVVHFTAQNLHHALKERAQLTVQILAGGASAALWNDDEAAAHAMLGTLSRDPDYHSSLILDAAGKPFVEHKIAGTKEPMLVTARAKLTKAFGDRGSQRIGTLELTLTTTRVDAESVSRGWLIAEVGIALLIVVCGALAWILHGVTWPILAMTKAMIDLAEGKVDVSVPRVPFKDEVGLMAAALVTLKSHANERLRFIARQARHMEEIERAVAERTQELTEALNTVRRTQNELVRSEKMAALGGMVAAIAHEINTPLGNSLTVATTLGDKIGELAKILMGTELRRSVLREYSEKFMAGNQLLIANLTRASELIGSFKRVAVDQTSEQRRRFDLAATLTENITILGPMFKKSSHSIAVNIAPGIWMDSYPGALSQVITNLVTNAMIHAFEERSNGSIEIRLETEHQEDDSIILIVSDDGIGMAPRVLARIFDPFFTTKLGTGGSGLGLHIVYVTVERILGGHIAASSDPGAGTRFEIRLPRKAPQQKEAEEK